jgi:S-formylglutathione hydrolase FrmB
MYRAGGPKKQRSLVRALLRMSARAVCIALLTAGLVGTSFSQKVAHETVNAKQVKLLADRLEDRVFPSESLAREMHYRILLPANYAMSARRYPVLYLLHGWHGDYKNWSTLTDLTHYAENLPIIIVMPDAGDSWYVNSATVSQDKF